ncbi:signal peptidase I [Enterococcus sp. BWM-S5]|uniref:Signal peptidase I n=1 Tax=Enterococcus larvae TaxID=2794352 RepID=A0ABS4CIY5_9ENTE|nr:signal peptidase I [Enterococcus larvae]MBP1046521.1 signal peptidase I [Enterococcus larvae]
MVRKKKTIKEKATRSKGKQGKKQAFKKKRRKSLQKTGKRKRVTLKQRVLSLKKRRTWEKLLYSFLQKEMIGLVLLLLVLVFFFRSCAPHQIDGQSMAPTFQSGDRIIIAKNRRIQRYTIVTFEPAGIPGESYVKRVIGLPGDQISVEGTALFLLPKESSSEAKEQFSEGLPDGTIKVTLSEEVAQTLALHDEIPDNQYFVLGDNRLHSDDSRVFGLVDEKQIEGVVMYRYYPFSKIGFLH